MYKDGCVATAHSGKRIYTPSAKVWPSKTDNTCTHKLEYSGDKIVRDQCALLDESECREGTDLFTKVTGKQTSATLLKVYHNQSLEICKRKCTEYDELCQAFMWNDVFTFHPNSAIKGYNNKQLINVTPE